MKEQPANHGKPWTTEQMWKLVELYDSPRTWFSIAQELERSISACQSRITFIKLAFTLSEVAGLTAMVGKSKVVDKTFRKTLKDKN